MKITKSQLKQIIKEEISIDDALLSAIENLTAKIEDLDISVDYLASSVTGEDPMAMGHAQNYLGRYKRPPSKKETASTLEEVIQEELEAYLEEDKDHPGESCDEAHPGQEHAAWEKEEEPLRIGTPKEDPWSLKKRLGIGGSVHNRLGGPRHREDK